MVCDGEPYRNNTGPLGIAPLCRYTLAIPARLACGHERIGAAHTGRSPAVCPHGQSPAHPATRGHLGCRRCSRLRSFPTNRFSLGARDAQTYRPARASVDSLAPRPGRRCWQMNEPTFAASSPPKLRPRAARALLRILTTPQADWVRWGEEGAALLFSQPPYEPDRRAKHGGYIANPRDRSARTTKRKADTR